MLFKNILKIVNFAAWSGKRWKLSQEAQVDFDHFQCSKLLSWYWQQHGICVKSLISIYSSGRKSCIFSDTVFWRLLSHSGCSNAYDNQVRSHTHDLLSIEVIKTHKYGLGKLMSTKVSFEKYLWYYVVSWLDGCNFLKKCQF